MRVLVYEPQYVGHNLAYAAHVVKAAASLGAEVHFATSQQAVESDEFQTQFEGMIGQFHVHVCGKFALRSAGNGVRLTGPTGAHACMSGLAQALQFSQPDHLYLTFGNPFVHTGALPFAAVRALRKEAIETEIILLFGDYAKDIQGHVASLRRRLAIELLGRGPWTRIHHVLPKAVRCLSMANSSRLAERVRLLPDPVEPSSQIDSLSARRLLEIPEHGKYISLLGLVERRKGIIELLRAFESALPAIDSKDRLLLAGKFSDEARTLLTTKYQSLVDRRKIVVLDRYLTTRELDAACRASNVVCTPYPSHPYSASIVIRAASARVPVLVNSVGWMREATELFGLGYVTNTNDSAEFAGAIARSVQTCHQFRYDERIERFEKYHSLPNFNHHITARLRERLAISSPIDLVEWPSLDNRAEKRSLCAA